LTRIFQLHTLHNMVSSECFCRIDRISAGVERIAARQENATMDEPTIGPHDRAEILDLLGRYLWAVDTGDASAVVAAFSPDGVVRYGTGERYEGEVGLRRFAQRVIGDVSVRGRMHLNHPLFFWGKGDCVVLRSYMMPVQLRSEAPNESIRSLRYTEDTFVKTGAGWRIKERAIFVWDQASRADA
jgi:hypothetical protein